MLDVYNIIIIISVSVYVCLESVCIGAYATFSVISRSTVVGVVLHSVIVSYTGPGSGCVGWLDST